MSLNEPEMDPLSLFSVLPGSADSNIILHIPHDSTHIPSAWRSDFSVSDEEIAREHARIVDWFTRDLYLTMSGDIGAALVSNLSRLVCDPERYENDAQEVMASRGVGVLYEKSTLGDVIRPRVSAARREEILSAFYRPYHQRFAELVEESLEAHGSCHIIDCHSYPAKALPYEINPHAPRPDVCLGTDPMHTPPWLINHARRLAEEAGFNVECDTPFKGTIVPLRYYGDARVRSLMIELNRGVYMDESTTAMHPRAERVRRWLRDFGRGLVAASAGAR
jgi:N-formylglutamate amidohydrolase